MSRKVGLNILTLTLSLTFAACGKSSPSANTVGPAVSPQDNACLPASHGQGLDPSQALKGLGYWVVIGDGCYFVPDNSQLQDEETEWTPYQRGYWSYDPQESWTWVSYEPWGGLTDHYGIWRHHQIHGWVWLPFEDRHFVAAAVTWFDEGDYVGWYPYASDSEPYYLEGDGFDDGYRDGYRNVLRLPKERNHFHMGFSLVRRDQFSNRNIRQVVIRDNNLVVKIAFRAHQEDRLRLGRVGRFPGGRREGAYEFLQRYSKAKAPVGPMQRLRNRQGFQILKPRDAFETPQEYRRRKDTHDFRRQTKR